MNESECETPKFSSLALVSEDSRVGRNTAIWHWTQIRERASVGNNVSVGQNVYIGPGVVIGDSTRIQNGAQIYEPAVLQDGVFIGPNVVLTNDRKPRALRYDNGNVKSEGDWEKVGVQINRGASLGANVVCVAPVVVGEWAMIGAGSVVTSDVKPYALIAGNPGRQIGWVGRGGSRLEWSGEVFRCPDTGELFRLSGDENLLRIIDN